MKRKFLGLGIMCLVALAAVIIWMAYREKRLENAFAEIQLDTEKTETRARLGLPWKTGVCGQTFGGSFSPDCKEEYIYASPYAPVLPHYWAFFFDQKGRLIDKYQYISP
jgi:hypothetical protein